jgi:hypothetical protein
MSTRTSDAEMPGHWRIASRAVVAARWLERQVVEERERWILWVPVFIGVGVAAYFELASEPPIWFGVAGLAGSVAARVVSAAGRCRPLPRPALPWPSSASPPRSCV